MFTQSTKYLHSVSLISQLLDVRSAWNKQWSIPDSVPNHVNSMTWPGTSLLQVTQMTWPYLMWLVWHGQTYRDLQWPLWRDLTHRGLMSTQWPGLTHRDFRWSKCLDLTLCYQFHLDWPIRTLGDLFDFAWPIVTWGHLCHRTWLIIIGEKLWSVMT